MHPALPTPATLACIALSAAQLLEHSAGLQPARPVPGPAEDGSIYLQEDSDNYQRIMD